MNRNETYNRIVKQRIAHTISFSGIYPPGGLVAWPDGSTSKIGEHRRFNPPGTINYARPKPFIAMPEKNSQLLRA